ncbi:MAG: hypothetical protein HC842_05470 [Cytophagales bacterium]|nr:hypothetical protein [Cytophagales bacterium]
MKKMMITLALAALAHVALAQGNGKGKGMKMPETRAQKQTEMMTKHLGLSPEQQGKVQEINLKYAKMNQEAFDTGVKQQIKANRAAREAELEQVLSPEQMSTLKAKQVEMKAVRKEKKKTKTGGDALEMEEDDL